MTFTKFSELQENPKVVWLPGTLHANTFLDVVVVKDISSLLSLGWYLFTAVSHNGIYPDVVYNGNALLITTNGNVSDASLVVPVVAIPFLDFVMIHLGKTLMFCLPFQKSVASKILSLPIL